MTKRTHLAILVVFLVLMSGLSLADLDDYPEMLFSQGEFKGKIVVGKKAPTADITSAIKLIPSLQELSEERIRGSMLDADVTDTTLENFHIISIGCENEVTKLILGECDLRRGESFIYLFDKYGHTQIIVIGGSEEDTAKATLVLGDYSLYELEGDAIRIIGDEIPYTIERVNLPEIDDEVLVVDEPALEVEIETKKEESKKENEPEVEELPKSQKQIELEQRLEEYSEEVEVEVPEPVEEEPKIEVDPDLSLHKKVWEKFKIWLSWFFK